MKGQELTNHNIMEFLKLLNELSNRAFVFRIKNIRTRMVDEFALTECPREEDYPMLTVNEAIQFIRLVTVASKVLKELKKDE